MLLSPNVFDGWTDDSLRPEALQPTAHARVDRVEPNGRTGQGDDDPTIVEPVAEVG